MHTLRFPRFLLLVALLGATALTALQARAATLVHNVRGYSMFEGERERFLALEYEDGVITRIYRDADELAGSAATTRLDGRGMTLLPGLIDAHGHVAGLGEALASVDLTGSASEAEAVQRVAARIAADPGDGWLVGGGWNQVLWPGRAFPTRASLDAVAAERPIVLRRIDGHALWVNGRALELAGIDDDTPDPVGGRIVRDESGRATGVLVDNAMDTVMNAMPAQDPAQIEGNITRAMRHLVSLGVTGTGDAGVPERELRAYERLDGRGGLLLRIYAMLASSDPALDAHREAGPRDYPGDLLRVRSVKVYADGALGSRGAALIEDYSDAPGERGLLLQSQRELRETMERWAKAGFQVNVHAIGDLANRRVLDEFARLNEDADSRALRHRIEHAQVIPPEDIPRFAELDVIASVQPTHATSDKNMAGDRLGEARLEGAYAWQTLIDSGARLAGGSDFPVEPANPFYGLHAAVTRQDRDGEPPGGWRASDALTRDQALSLFTEDAAYAAHQEDRVGRLRPGYAADFILVADDYFEVAPEQLWQNRVLMTVVGGRTVYTAPPFAAASD